MLVVIGVERSSRGTGYSLQEDQGAAGNGLSYFATACGPDLTVRHTPGGKVLQSQATIRKVRTAIALHNAASAVITAERDEDGIWCARVTLAPGIAAFGDGSTREEAVADCRTGFGLLVEGLRGDPPGLQIDPRDVGERGNE